tara:strand:- start:106 stop:939 length:834 start_codon:yes stop_codon:yes gene_type:complete
MGLEGKLPVVTVIGTCRVHHTLRNLAEKKRIVMNNGGLGTFIHSTPEAVLRLKVLLQLETYKETLLKLQVGESNEKKTKPDEGFDFSETDILVVEISTIKSLSANGNPLQFNEVARHMCTPHGDFGMELRQNLNNAFNKREHFVQMPKQKIPDEFPEEFSNLISELVPVVQDSKIISSDLDEIRNLAKIPVLFVNHINLPGTNGKLITSRNKLCNIINEYAEERNLQVFNPATMFEEYEAKDLLMKEGNDLNHYAKDKLEIVGEIQLKSISKLLNSN